MSLEEIRTSIQAPGKRFWDSRKFWFGLLIILSWTWLIDRMLVLDIGAGSKSLEIPQEIWWAMVIKGALEALTYGGVAALDVYAAKLPFNAFIEGLPARTPPVSPAAPVEGAPNPKPPSGEAVG